MRAYFGRLLIVAQLLLILCFMRIATAQTDTPDGLLLERFESQLKAEEGKLLGGRTESSSSQVADGKDVTAYQLIASREELSYLKLATDARGLQPIFNTTAKDLVTYLLPSNDAFRTLLREVNRGRQPPRGANQSEFYLLSSLTKDPIVPIILVYNIFPNRRWTSQNMAAGKTMISKYNQFPVNIVEDVGATDNAHQNGKPPIMLETENSPAPPARIVEYDLDLLGPSVAHITNMVLLPPYIAEIPPNPTPNSAPDSPQTKADLEHPREPAPPAPPCDDLQPSPEFTCAQQKAWGKCQAIWMVQGNFCRATCGACTPDHLPQSSSPEDKTGILAGVASETGAQLVTVTDVGPTNVTLDSGGPSSRKLLVGVSVTSRPSVAQQEEEEGHIEQPQPAGQQVSAQDQANAAQRSLLLRSRFAGALQGLRGAQRIPRRGQMQQQQQQRMQAAKPRQ